MTEQESRSLRVGMDYRPALLSSTGIARSVRELARAMAKQAGVELHLFGHSFARARRGEVPIGAAKLHRLPIPGRLLPRLARFGLGADRLSSSVPLFHWMDYVYPPLSRAKSVLTIHDMAFALHPEAQPEAVARDMLARTRQAADRASACICPTAASAKQVTELLAMDPGKLRVIPFGVDHLPAELPRDQTPSEPFLLSLGTIEPRKNHLRLLQAWRRLGAQRPLLVIIGRIGWDCAETVIELEREQVGGRLLWLQEADDALVFAHMDRALALVYPSLMEGFGFPPLEALALGTPVLAGDNPALREVLQDCVLYCDPESREHIAEQLQRLLQDPQASQARCQAGRHRAAEFTWQRCAERHLDLYREVLA